MRELLQVQMSLCFDLRGWPQTLADYQRTGWPQAVAGGPGRPGPQIGEMGVVGGLRKICEYAGRPSKDKQRRQLLLLKFSTTWKQ